VANVQPGKEHAGAHGMEGLWRMLESLPRERWPTFVRGDCGYDNEKIMTQFEERCLPYLLKLRHTTKVKALVRDVLGQLPRNSLTSGAMKADMQRM